MTLCKRCLKHEPMIDNEYCKSCIEHFTLDFKSASKEINKVRLKQEMETLLKQLEKVKKQIDRLEK